jgi:hypothetical protein
MSDRVKSISDQIAAYQEEQRRQADRRRALVLVNSTAEPSPAPAVPPKPQRRAKNNLANNLTSEIVASLLLAGVHAYRVNTTGTYRPAIGKWVSGKVTKGVSDILGTLPGSGRSIAIEVKIGKDTLSEDQKTFLANVVRCGGIAIEARDTYKDFYQKLTSQLKENEKWLLKPLKP